MADRHFLTIIANVNRYGMFRNCQVVFRIIKFVISRIAIPSEEHVFCEEISCPIMLGDFSPDKQHRNRNDNFKNPKINLDLVYIQSYFS